MDFNYSRVNFHKTIKILDVLLSNIPVMMDIVAMAFLRALRGSRIANSRKKEKETFALKKFYLAGNSL